MIVDALDLGDATMRAAWSGFVADHPDSTPFHRLEWLEAVAAGCGQPAHGLIARVADGTVAAVLPLTEVRSPLFGSSLVSSGFAVGGGVLGDAPWLAQSAIRVAERLHLGTVELRGGAMPGEGWVVQDSAYAGFERPLAADDEAELKAIPRKQRAEVRRAEGFGLDVRVGRDARDLDDHYRIYAESVRNLGTPVFPRALFREVVARFGDDADILTVLKDGEPLASVLSLYHGGAVMPYWGGGGAAARTFRANDHMYWALMRHARMRGCTSFDFGRSKPGTGAYAFKRNWGFDPKPLTYYRHAREGKEARDINPLNPKYRMMTEVWRRLPIVVANRVGPMLSRGLG